MKLTAVISGDIAGSRDLPQRVRERMADSLRMSYEEVLSSAHGLGFVEGQFSDIAIFSGDSWQFAMRPAWLAPRIAIGFHAWLRGRHEGLVTRVSLAQGPSGASLIKPVNEQQDAPFVASGEGLEEMRDHQILSWSLDTDPYGSDSPVWAKSWTRLLDALAGGWTDRQCEVLARALFSEPQAEIANHIRYPVSQQAVSAHLQAAEFGALEQALTYVEFMLKAYEP